MTSRVWNEGDPEPSDRPAVVDDDGVTPWQEMRAAADLLELAADQHVHDRVDVWGFAGEWMDPWVQLHDPKSATHLCEWMRRTADFEEWVSNPLVCTPGPHPMEILNAAVGAALEFARAVNARRSAPSIARLTEPGEVSP